MNMLAHALMVISVLTVSVHGQSVPVSEPVIGTVRDTNGGVLPGAIVTLLEDGTLEAVETTFTAADGRFIVRSARSGRARLRITLSGFAQYEESIVIDDTARPSVDVILSLSHLQEEVAVHGTISDVALARATRVERRLIETLPSESLSSGLSSMLTLTSPGIAADSNGGFHPLGEHAETSFSIDNQPISDQQSRIFSNQLSTNAIESIDVFTGVPPAEFGDKTSAVASITTRSGLGVHGVRGSASLGYGSFRTPTASLAIGRGSDRVGAFFALDGIISGRFLDTPEA